MHFQTPRELVEDHHRRLRDDAQAPAPAVLAKLWALIRRREEPAPVVSLPAREIERLAA